MPEPGRDRSYQKQLAFGFWERSTGVSPVSFGVLFGFDERKSIDQSPHGQDGHAPFLRDAKSNFKETLVSDFEKERESLHSKVAQQTEFRNTTLFLNY